jgi:hypothetical protein
MGYAYLPEFMPPSFIHLKWVCRVCAKIGMVGLDRYLCIIYCSFCIAQLTNPIASSTVSIFSMSSYGVPIKIKLSLIRSVINLFWHVLAMYIIFKDSHTIAGGDKPIIARFGFLSKTSKNQGSFLFAHIARYLTHCFQTATNSTGHVIGGDGKYLR